MNGPLLAQLLSQLELGEQQQRPQWVDLVDSDLATEEPEEEDEEESPEEDLRPRGNRTVFFSYPDRRLFDQWDLPAGMEEEPRTGVIGRKNKIVGEIWLDELCALAGGEMVSWVLQAVSTGRDRETSLDFLKGLGPEVCELTKADDLLAIAQQLFVSNGGEEGIELRRRRRFLNLAVIWTMFIRRYLRKIAAEYSSVGEPSVSLQDQVTRAPFFRQFLERYLYQLDEERLLPVERDVTRADVVSMAQHFQANDLPIVAVALVQDVSSKENVIGIKVEFESIDDWQQLRDILFDQELHLDGGGGAGVVGLDPWFASWAGRSGARRNRSVRNTRLSPANKVDIEEHHVDRAEEQGVVEGGIMIASHATSWYQKWYRNYYPLEKDTSIWTEKFWGGDVDILPKYHQSKGSGRGDHRDASSAHHASQPKGLVGARFSAVLARGEGVRKPLFCSRGDHTGAAGALSLREQLRRDLTRVFYSPGPAGGARRVAESRASSSDGVSLGGNRNGILASSGPPAPRGSARAPETCNMGAPLPRVAIVKPVLSLDDLYLVDQESAQSAQDCATVACFNIDFYTARLERVVGKFVGRLSSGGFVWTLQLGYGAAATRPLTPGRVYAESERFRVLARTAGGRRGPYITVESSDGGGLRNMCVNEDFVGGSASYAARLDGGSTVFPRVWAKTPSSVLRRGDHDVFTKIPEEEKSRTRRGIIFLAKFIPFCGKKGQLRNLSVGGYHP